MSQLYIHFPSFHPDYPQQSLKICYFYARSSCSECSWPILARSLFPGHRTNFRFTCDLFHPNIYQDGRVCISILHAPGDDPTGYESSSERYFEIGTIDITLFHIAWDGGLLQCLNVWSELCPSSPILLVSYLPIKTHILRLRWSPVQSIEKILLSVVSMLAGATVALPCRIVRKWQFS